MTDALDRLPFKNRMGLRAPDIRPVREVIRDVCDKHQMTLGEILSPRRFKSIVLARQEAMWECRRQTRASYPQIADALGLADHTTVIHGIRRHEERMRATDG